MYTQLRLGNVSSTKIRRQQIFTNISSSVQNNKTMSGDRLEYIVDDDAEIESRCERFFRRYSFDVLIQFFSL